MPPPPSSPPQANGTGIIWVGLGIFVLAALIWYFGHTYIVIAFFFVKRIEISIIQFFIGWLGNLDEIKQFILKTYPVDIPFSTVSFVARQVGSYVRFPVILLFVLMSLILLSRSMSIKYSKTYSMDSLLRQEVEVWPYSKVVVDLDLVNKDIHEGPWAIAMRPMRFAKKYKLLKESIIKPSDISLDKETKVVVSLLKPKAFRVFAMQLEKPWEGVETLSDHVKALYAAFAVKAARDPEKSMALLRQFASSVAEGSLDLSGVDEVLAKCKDYPPIVEITNKHGYVLTVMASMLQLARSDGVISSAEFLWLKPVDRRLWFMLNSIGRQTAVVEVAGPFSHWLAEKAIGRKLKMPMVEQAVKALDLALQEIRYKPEET